MDHWLQPYVKELQSYIKDSASFINLIEKLKLPNDCLLVSIDVSSLYTNIPHKDGRESLLYYVSNEELKFKHPEQPEPEIIVELAKIVLKNNVIEFNNKFYLQKQGTAMGTKMAPSYANLFMGKLENKLNNRHIHTWKRYIDDIFIIWTGNKSELETYISHINTVHQTLKFTYEAHENELVFLDTILYKGDRFKKENILHIRTHNKKTNKQLYIHKKTYHPKHVKKAIITGETTRYLRTNSSKSTFDNMKIKLIHKLKQRGYTHKGITKEIHKTNFNQRSESLKRKTKQNKHNSLIFCTNYCDKTQWVKKVINKHWKRVLNNPYLKIIFPSKPIIAQRTAPNLRNKLIRAKLQPMESDTSLTPNPNPNRNPNPNKNTYPSITPIPNPNPNQENDTDILEQSSSQTPESYPFNLFNKSKQAFRNPTKRCSSNWNTCKHLSTQTFVQSTLKKTKHPIRLAATNEHYNCNTKEVVYLLTCNNASCKTQYVGYTNRKIKYRFI